MKLLQVAAAVLLVALVTGCAQKPSGPKPTPAPYTREAPLVPPMTTYGCDPLLTVRLGPC